MYTCITYVYVYGHIFICIDRYIACTCTCLILSVHNINYHVCMFGAGACFARCIHGICADHPADPHLDLKKQVAAQRLGSGILATEFTETLRIRILPEGFLECPVDCDWGILHKKLMDLAVEALALEFWFQARTKN